MVALHPVVFSAPELWEIQEAIALRLKVARTNAADPSPKAHDRRAYWEGRAEVLDGIAGKIRAALALANARPPFTTGVYPIHEVAEAPPGEAPPE